MRAAVTGGTGCLGIPLVHKLIRQGFQINLLISPHGSAPEFSSQQVRLVTGRLDSRTDMDLLTQGCKVVFHLAGKVHAVPRTVADVAEFYRVNVDGTKTLLESSRSNGVKRLIHYSTVGVYGLDGDCHCDED